MSRWRRNKRLVFVGGHEANEYCVHFIARQLCAQVDAADYEAFTWRSAMRHPEELEKAAEEAVLVTYSRGADTLLDTSNSANHPAVTAKEIVLVMAPTIITGKDYLHAALNYGRLREGHPEARRRMDELLRTSPHLLSRYGTLWGLARIIPEVLSGRQTDRLQLAYDISRSRHDSRTSLLTATQDQYYPSSDLEVARAGRLGVPISVVDWTHDFVAFPNALYYYHEQQIGGL